MEMNVWHALTQHQVLTHQKWSGANYVDSLLTMVSGGISSTAAMGKGVTEDQFKSEAVGDHGTKQ